MKMSEKQPMQTLRQDISRKLQEDGLDPGCQDEDKILHLWTLYIKTEANLKASLDNIEELRENQSEEMKEFENYVEHVRSLSSEREALTLEFAAENDGLKTEIEQLKQELDSYKSDETRDMLLQQGLDDIAYGTTSEQVAYLLVERARLLDELEMEEGHQAVDTGADGVLGAEQLYTLLQQERSEFEQELSQQRSSLKSTQQLHEKSHEEEISALMEENDKVQGMLEQSRKKITRLEEQVEELQDSLERKGAEAVSEVNKRKVASTDAAGAPTQRETNELKLRVMDLEADNKTLMDNVKTLTLELQEAKRADTGLLMPHTETDDLGAQLGRSLSPQIHELQQGNQKLVAERKAQELKMDFMEKQIEDLLQREKDLKNQMKSLKHGSEEDVTKTKYMKQIEELKRENGSLNKDLKSTLTAFAQERECSQALQDKVEALEVKVNETQRLEEQLREFDRERERLKMKVSSLEAKVESLEDALTDTQQHSHRAQDKVKKNLEGSLTQTQTQLEQLQTQYMSLMQEKNQTETQVQHMELQTAALHSTVEQHLLHIHDLDTDNSQLQQDKQELTHKLSEAIGECQEKETQLDFEKKRLSVSKDEDHADDSQQRLQHVNQDVDSLRREHQRVSSQLTTKQQELHQLGAEKSKLEAKLTSVKQELEDKHRSQDLERISLTSKIDQCFLENRELRNTMAQLEGDLSQARRQVEQSKNNENKLENQLCTENRAKADLHERNKSLELETEKAWNKLKDLLEKVTRLESTNDRLQAELERKSQDLKEYQNLHAQRDTQHSTQLRVTQARADSTDKQLYSLQSDLDQALQRLREAEQQVRDSSSLRLDLEEKQDEVTRLRNQLHQEKLQKSKASHSSEELSSQISGMRDKERDLQKRNNELQHMLLDLESRLEAMKGQTRSASDVRQSAEHDQLQLTGQLSGLQKEVERLQRELFSMSEKHDAQLKRYTDRKLRTKNKLQRARDVFQAEKVKLRAEVERLKCELTLARQTLSKDHDWKDNLESSHQRCLLEKRDLLSQLAEQEEQIRDVTRKLSMLTVRTKFLEEENNTLQQRVDSLVRQKHNLDRIVKDYQFERHKEESYGWHNTSLTYESLFTPRGDTTVTSDFDSSCLHDNTAHEFPMLDNSRFLDAIISPRVTSLIGRGSANQRLSQTLPTFSETPDPNSSDSGEQPIPRLSSLEGADGMIYQL